MKKAALKIKIVAGVVIALCFVCSGSYAEENFSMGGSIGALSINDAMYYRVALQPAFKFGKLKVGANLALTWNDTDGIKPWGPEDWANLILYIQWAEKGDRPLYFRIGDLQTATLGHGFIFSRYSNMTQKAYLNAYKNIGVELDLDFNKAGVETVFNNILGITTYGIRPYWRPLKTFNVDIPILSELAIGATYATDVETGVFVDTTAVMPERRVQIYGADLDLPIIARWLIYYVDMGWMVDHGNGWATGFMGGGPLAEFLSFNYRFEYRNIGADFSPNFFDNYYEMSKPKTVLSSKERYNGWYGELGFGFFGAVSIMVSYEDSFMNNAKLDGHPWLHGELAFNEKLFSFIKQRISLSASYDHKNMDQGRPEDQIFEGRFGYGISSNVDIIYAYTQKYTSTGDPVRTSAIETRLHF